jgi:hypothetical protein
MQFTTVYERDEYLDRARRQGVAPGSAREHAVSVNLGIWGDKNALFRDCAEIYAGEVIRRFKTREKVPLPMKFDLAEVIADCGAFRDAFNRWRRIPDFELDQVMSGIIESQKPPEPLNARDLYVDEDYVMERVINSLRSIKDSWTRVGHYVS